MSLQSYTGSSSTSNGNGTARLLMRGASLAHRSRLTKSQRAVIAANIDDGVVDYQPTQTGLAKDLGVSIAMVQRAKRLSALSRQQVMGGKVTVGHFTKSAVSRPVINLFKHDDLALRAIIKRRGVNYVVDIAAAMEAAE
jgi:hypothetical protein